MSASRRTPIARLAVGAAMVTLVGGQVVPTIAEAQPAPPSPGAPTPELLHNVVYRARADGTSRGAVVAYKQDDRNVNSAQPTMLPGQTFEVNTVLTDPAQAGMQVSIQWPYGSNLHCEILVDDQIVAQADQFIAPRLFRVKDDPLYGTLQCGAPLNLPVAATGGAGAAEPAQDAPLPPD